MSQLLLKVERVANRLPHPMALFIYLCLLVWLLSALGQMWSWQAMHPATGEWLSVKSLVSESGLVFMLSTMVTNFTGFAPVGPVVVMALAFSLAERSGLLPSLISKLTLNTPQGFLAIAVAFLGVMSSIAVDSGYVVLLPLCAAVFLAAGRHPLAGLALGFACVSGGFSANLLVGPVDAMLAGISSEALALVVDDEVSILANYYFMVVSVFVVVLTCVMVNRVWVEPYLLRTSPLEHIAGFEAEKEQDEARFGSGFLITLCLIVMTWLWLTLPQDGVLRNEQGGLLTGPFMSSLVVMIALSVAVLATVFGIENGRVGTWQKWVESLEQGIKDIAPYLVLMFVVAQFIAWFKWSQLGLVTAIHLAGLLESMSVSGPVALMSLMLFAALVNIFIGSASAKWGLLAPIVVPAFYLLGIEPQAVQGAYRVADSSTNIITPLMPYFPLVLAYGQKYELNLSVGRLLTIMLPYSLALLLIWGSLFAVWYLIGWPQGPEISK